MDLSKLRGVFVGESDELLGRLEQALLTAEKDLNNAEVLRTIFQVIHTLKGNAATMGLAKMAELAHHLEDALMPVREGKFALTAEWVNFLLESMDVIRALLAEFQANKDMGVDIAPTMGHLNVMVQSAAAGGAPASQAAAAASAGPAPQAVNTTSPAAPAPKPAAPVIEPAAAKTSAPGTAPKTAPAAQAGGAAAAAAPAAEAEARDVVGAAVAVGEEFRKEAQAKDGELQKTTVRVQLRHLDNMMNLVGELTITKSRLIQYSQELGVPALSAELKFLERLSAQLQEEVLQTRMVPVEDIFQRYRRVVRDISHELKKDANFVIQDNGISVDRVLLEKINAAVVHLLRNSIDHGIEDPEERRLAGKPPIGTVSLVARHEKNYAVVEVMDDGRGINVERVKEKAIERGIITPEKAAKMPEHEAFYLTCHPGLSTKEEITQFSGRGVGMDVVQETIESINGHLDINSTLGQGSRFALFLPLNLAILQALLLKAGPQTFALPLSDVLEIVSLSIVKPVVIDKQEVITLRNEVLPLVRLNKLLRIESGETGYALVVQSHKSKFALVVDALVGRQEIVLKNLTGFMKQIQGIGGATILGDGRAILILDVQGLI